MKLVLKNLKTLITKINQKGFNQFDVFSDIFKENCITKILEYLFQSDENHFLGSKFCAQFLEVIEAKKLYLAIKETDFTNVEVEATFNMATDKKRFIDLVVECFKEGDENRENPFFVFGIEVKKWDVERSLQIADYQKFLAKKYKCPSLMLYLTPHGKESITYDKNSDCKYKNISYHKIKEVCDEVKGCNDEVNIFLRKFGDYMSASIAGKISKKLQEEIIGLWSSHNSEMQLISNYGKNPKNPRSFIYEKLISALNEHETINSAYIVWHYARNVAVPKEYNLSINRLDQMLLKKKPYKIYFMIKCQSDDPMDKSSWTVSVAAWPDSQKYDKTAETDAKKYKEMFDVDTICKWSPWTFFESSHQFTLDFEKSDSSATTDVIIKFIDTSLKRLKEFYNL